MSACDLQGIPKDVLSVFRPAQRRHRRPKKVGDHYAMNYTLKLPLSLRAAMHYAAVQSCQKRVIPGLLNAPLNRLDVDPAKHARQLPPPACEVATARSIGSRNC